MSPKFLLSAFLLSAVSLSFADSVPTDPPPLKRKLAVGLAYTGGLIRYGFRKWSLEGRYLVGKASSNDGDVHSTAIGFRTYRHFHTDRKLQWFGGTELAYLSAKSDAFKTSVSMAFGAFGGAEYYILPRLSIGLDLGPYYLIVKQDIYKDSESGLDFILNTFLNFYIF